MIGQTVSHYRILEKLGEGGMGVVYKAQDTTLDRTVALKFIAANLIKDSDARKRFEREAKAAAGVSHANVCHVYQIAESEGHSFLAMEFVEGESLDKRIERGPLALKDALEFARQTAEGLAAAHEQGVVHRDVKPGNLLITPKGQVKILDFGLALLTEGSKLTQLDTKVGTVAYMSPEQAQGMDVDHRTDVWALGCVLYEMVSGRRPFLGHYDQALVYSIVNEPPEPLTGLRTGVPMELEFIVGKCLEKDPGNRYQHVSDIAVDLRNLQDKLKSGRSTILRGQVVSQTMAAPPDVTTQSPVGPLVRYRVIESVDDSADSARYLAEDTELHRSVSIRVLPQSSAEKIERRQRRNQTIAFAAGAVGVLLAVIFALFPLSSPPPAAETPLRRFALPIDGPPVQSLAISPDGRHIAYTAGVGPGARSWELWIWDLDSLEPRKIETGGPVVGPFWSPDSNFLAFRMAGQPELKKVSVRGGPASTICSVGLTFLGGSWSPDGSSIVFSSRAESGPPQLFQVSAQGGTAKPLIDAAESDGLARAYPYFLPAEGRSHGVLFSQGPSPADTQLAVFDLKSGRQVVLVPGSRPVYSPTGHIVYESDNALWALPFSIETLHATGEPFPVSGSGSWPTVARDGTLAYLRLPGAALQQLVWRDRTGHKLGTIGAPQPVIEMPVLSPGGSQVAVVGTENGNRDVWVHETARSLKRRLTFDPSAEDRPAWTPNGDKITFASPRNGNYDVFIKSADGRGEDELLFDDPKNTWGFDWSADGAYLVGSGQGKLWYRHAKQGGGYEKVMFLDTPFDALSPDLSPDAKFLAYESNESDRYEVYVQPFPEGGAKWQVSNNGGGQPRWRGDGKEMFYVENGKLMAVPVTTGSSFSVGNAELLFEDKTAFTHRGHNYDVTPDGQKFVTVETIGAEDSVQAIHVVFNWFEEFRGQEKH